MADSGDTLPIFLTAKQACGILGVSRRFLQNIIKGKKGPPVYWMGARMRFKKSEFFDWIDTTKA